MGLAQGRRQRAHGQPCPAPGWEHGPGHDTWPCGFRLPGFVVLFFFLSFSWKRPRLGEEVGDSQR